MDFQDYYKTLGIDRTAKATDIKKAYRQLALKYHPDKNREDPKAHEQFIKIQEAYEVLQDADKKLKYDQLYDIRAKVKSTGYQKSTNQKTSNYHTYTGFTVTEDDTDTTSDDEDNGVFSNFFKQFFSKKKSKYDYSYLYKGKDLKGKIVIDLEESFLGSDRIISVYNEKLRIKIKRGVNNNQIIKVKGKGAYGELGAQRGDLYITILIKPNQIFKRKDNDLYRDINVNIYTAILGGKIQFETLHGSVIIGIPEGTVTGTQLRVKGKGMPVYSNPDEYGDLYVNIQNKMPTALSEEEKNLLRKLKQISNKK